VQPATTYAAVEVHEDEKVAIAAEPYDTKEKESIFKVDYLSHGVMPVRLIVTNNGDRPISLRDARILFLTAEGEKIQAAEPEDVERLMTQKERQGSKIPMPGPIPSIKLKPKASNQEIEQDFNTFEYQALVVEAHTTRAGFLFYDVSQLDHPLKGAKLHLHKLRTPTARNYSTSRFPSTSTSSRNRTRCTSDIACDMILSRGSPLRIRKSYENQQLCLAPSAHFARSGAQYCRIRGVSLNQLINTAVAQMIAAHSTSNYISIRAKRANLPRTLEILSRAGAGNPPIEGDELPESWKDRSATRNK